MLESTRAKKSSKISSSGNVFFLGASSGNASVLQEWDMELLGYLLC